MTRTLEVGTHPAYSVHVGPGLLGTVANELERFSRIAIVTDENVAGLYLSRLKLQNVPHLAVPAGEGAKTMAGLETVLEFLIESGLDRSSTVLAVGGGVVGDLAGMAASLFMRGIACVQVPTTLLAMVDSSVGGKTAVNLKPGKNLAGTFHQPSAVYADVETLRSLPEDELASGLGEVVKTALIGDAELLALLEERAEEIRGRDADLLEEVVARCVRVKADIVARDERESGERKVLNLGHTFAHGIEHAAGFGRVPHGVAVAVGLTLALKSSSRLGLLADADLPDRVKRLLARLGLPTSLSELRGRYDLALTPVGVQEGMRHDKKGAPGRPLFVLVRGIGAPVVDQEVEPDLVNQVLAELPA